MLDDALIKLERENPQAADLAKLRLFAGLTVDEAADSLGISRRTGFRLWTYAPPFFRLISRTTCLARQSEEKMSAAWHWNGPILALFFRGPKRMGTGPFAFENFRGPVPNVMRLSCMFLACQSFT